MIKVVIGLVMAATVSGTALGHESISASRAAKGFSGGVALAHSAPDPATTVVNNFISRQAEELEAEEYADARKLLRRDVNHDGKLDLVVLYTLEGFNGGNAYRQYLAVFLGRGKNFRYADHDVVGGKLLRDVSLISVSAGTIALNTKEYKKNDPACCPSRKGKASYVLSKGKLKALK